MTESDSNHVPEDPKRVRLQRFLASCGYGSRRGCEDLISEGRVTVNKVVVDKLGATVDPAKDQVAVDGERVKTERKQYFMLNKPTGYLCTAYDPAHRPLVLELFPADGPRLFTVGRLDENTTGLLIVTNDGDLAQQLAHPRYRIYRQYRALVAGLPKPEVYDQLKEGFFFTEGKFRVYDIKSGKKQGTSTWVEITMIEGQNREIRRLFARVGHKVMKLERIGFGPLHLGRLPIGEYRELLPGEMAKLRQILDRNAKGSTPYTAPRGAKKKRPAPPSAPVQKRPSVKKKVNTGKQTLMGKPTKRTKADN